MEWRSIHTVKQILDLPGIIEGAKDGKGRGRQVIAGKCGFAYNKQAFFFLNLRIPLFK